MDAITFIFAGVFLIIGAVECFAGFKLMKSLIAIWGFLVGALLGTVIGDATNSVFFGIILVIAFGTALAIVAYKNYPIGVFILTVFLAGVAFYIMTYSKWIPILAAIGAGALVIYRLKPAIIVITAVSGAGIIIEAAHMMLSGGRQAGIIVAILWIPIALSGIVIQFMTTRKKRKSQKNLTRQSFPTTEGKNDKKMIRTKFCIMCGYEFYGNERECPECGYRIDNI